MNNKSNCNHEHDHNHNHDHSCCEHNHDDNHIDEEFETIVLTLEDDTELECIILGIFDYEDRSYIALVPAEDEEGDEVLLYDFVELDNNEIELNVIEDERLFDEVSEEFENLFLEKE
ncbi:DUF1292 domain-containing protein [Anaerosphaera multitolerans]|uniref:DUF1292 domain-containing protein n=1 Tax=Anaerosphaera multitolerans TaxID=2487351 RepID=A0A437S7Y1_9FIRM|nr:DUF1292 domain-containing protein [Anaerosphaera multitolerans]RVU55190.1 DUF1292 domain-containing protein [Anaerosphaera multitolerans]